jgi:hypothetical protein
MSGMLDFEDRWKGARELIDRVVDLQTEIQVYENRLESMEMLLDRILICLNAYENGESRHSLASILEAIVQEIYCHRMTGDISRPARS